MLASWQAIATVVTQVRSEKNTQMLSAGFETRKTSEADSSVPNAAFIGAKFGKTVSMCTPDCFSALLVCCL